MADTQDPIVPPDEQSAQGGDPWNAPLADQGTSAAQWGGTGTYVGDPTPASDPKYKAIPQIAEKDENAILYRLAAVHPFAVFHESTFIDLLEHSLSLPLDEKKAVIDAIPRLSQYQIDELIKVFVDEREEFKKIFSEDKDMILARINDIQREWTQLRDMYESEEKSRVQQASDQIEAARLRAALDESGSES